MGSGNSKYASVEPDTASVPTEGHSVTIPISNHEISEGMAMKLVLPNYFTREKPTPNEVEEIIAIWEMIARNNSEFFFNLKKQHTEENIPFKYDSCADYFSGLFYKGLAGVNKEYEAMFSSSKPRMRLYFMEAMSVLLEAYLGDKPKFIQKSEGIAKVHCKVGIKAFEYGIGCEVLMTCIKSCVGEQVYTPRVHQIWVKFFSNFLLIILPITIQHELSSELQDGAIKRRKYQHMEKDGELSPRGRISPPPETNDGSSSD